MTTINSTPSSNVSNANLNSSSANMCTPDNPPAANQSATGVTATQDGYDGLRQLRVVYDVEIDSYANVQTFPGTYIYVDPTGFDPGFQVDKISLTELGVGGYYMIIRSEHEFAAGKAIVFEWFWTWSREV